MRALSFHPYYPYPDKEFSTPYVKNSYDKWKLTNDAENDVTFIEPHGAVDIFCIEDTKEKKDH